MIPVAQPETLGAYLRELRERTDRNHLPLRVTARTRRKKGMSREEVAAMAGCSASYVEKIERGVSTNVSSEIVLGLTSAVGATEQQATHAMALAGDPHPLPPAAGPPKISSNQVAYVDSLTPHLAGYVDLAWNLLYTNEEYRRVFRGIEEYGNVLYWLFECPDAKNIMVDWFHETHLTVTWSRSLAVLHSVSAEYERVFGRLEQVKEFREMRAMGDPTMGRRDPAQIICDPDSGETFGLSVNLWSPPSASANWQMYLGVRC